MTDARSTVLAEMAATADALLPLAEVGRLVDRIEAARRVYLHGVGRSGCVIRMLAIRLAQLDVAAVTVGEPSATAAGPGDLLIAASGTGETSTVVAVAGRARAGGAHVVALTAAPGASLARGAQEVIALPGVTKTGGDGDAGPRSVQPPGSLFEQMLFCFCEEAILLLATRRDHGFAMIRRRHANLE